MRPARTTTPIDDGSPQTREQLDRALEIAEAEGLDTIAILSVGDAPVDPGPGYETVQVDRIGSSPTSRSPLRS